MPHVRIVALAELAEDDDNRGDDTDRKQKFHVPHLTAIPDVGSGQDEAQAEDASSQALVRATRHNPGDRLAPTTVPAIRPFPSERSSTPDRQRGNRIAAVEAHRTTSRSAPRHEKARERGDSHLPDSHGIVRVVEPEVDSAAVVSADVVDPQLRALSHRHVLGSGKAEYVPCALPARRATTWGRPENVAAHRIAERPVCLF
ncbi:hypothetical protein GCM10027089_20390 [Nocardia thraciensis]